ncbi:fructokinase [alpha proteobacterium U9-1i]|nr:fructokinase [alpha proteobacterium U9-1i]
MSKARYDVAGIGNAIIDIIQPVPDSFLVNEGIEKDSMTLIEESRADYLTSKFTSATVAPGGSAANTMTGIASFGGRAAYMGKVADDELGAQYRREFVASGVDFRTPPYSAPPGTARSLIAVTPDAHRSMNTFLGASSLLSIVDVDDQLVRDSSVLFLEGYLFDREAAKMAFVHAAEIARAAGRKVSLTLSDLFCVDRHHQSFLHLVDGHVDILFANEREILRLYETDSLAAAIEAARAHAPITAITRSEHGSIVVARDETIEIKAAPVAQLVDTTGAGDQYAAGFLFGLSRERGLAECGALASLAAAEVISHMGPRPDVNLRGLALQHGMSV